MNSTLSVPASVARLAEIVHTSPFRVGDINGANPDLVESLLRSRSQYCDERLQLGVSILDAVRVHYGDEAARLCVAKPSEGDVR